jgi:hypothetical protein
MAGECQTRAKCLHLVASDGRPRDPSDDWRRLDGRFRHFPLAVRKIGRVASTNQHITVEDVRAEPQWIAHPDWVRQEGIILENAVEPRRRDERNGFYRAYCRFVCSPVG